MYSCVVLPLLPFGRVSFFGVPTISPYKGGSSKPRYHHWNPKTQVWLHVLPLVNTEIEVQMEKQTKMGVEMEMEMQSEIEVQMEKATEIEVEMLEETVIEEIEIDVQSD